MAAQQAQRQVHPGEVVPRQAQDFRGLILDASRALVPLGVSAGCFNERTALELGYTDSMVAGLLRPFIGLDDEVKAERMLMIGFKRGFFQQIRGTQPEAWFRFFSFLKSQPGQQALNEMNYQEKLMKRGQGKFTAQEIGWISMFEALRADYSNRAGEIRKGLEDQIAAVELQLKNLKVQLEQQISALPQQFRPLDGFQPLSVPAFNRACWDEFVAECRVHNVQPVELNKANLTDAVFAHGDVIRQRHILTFLEGEGRKDLLKDYVENKIGYFND